MKKVLNERKRRLLEFLDDKFFSIAEREGVNYWSFAEAGFMLGLHESKGLDGFMIPKNGYSDVDFIKYLRDSNLREIELEELREELAYFLCGYDHFKQVEGDAKINPPKTSLQNYYLDARDNLSVRTNDVNETGFITDAELEEKRNFIQQILDTE